MSISLLLHLSMPSTLRHFSVRANKIYQVFAPSDLVSFLNQPFTNFNNFTKPFTQLSQTVVCSEFRMNRSRYTWIVFHSLIIYLLLGGNFSYRRNLMAYYFVFFVTVLRKNCRLIQEGYSNSCPFKNILLSILPAEEGHVTIFPNPRISGQ